MSDSTDETQFRVELLQRLKVIEAILADSIKLQALFVTNLAILIDLTGKGLGAPWADLVRQASKIAESGVDTTLAIMEKYYAATQEAYQNEAEDGSVAGGTRSEDRTAADGPSDWEG